MSKIEIETHDDFRYYLVVGETDTVLTFLIVETGVQVAIPARRSSFAPTVQAPAAGVWARIRTSRAFEGGYNVQVQHVEYADGTNSGYLGDVLRGTVLS